MRRKIVCASDFSNTTVGCHDNNWSLVTFKRSIEEREALYIKHVDFIDEKHTRYDLSSSFFSPFSYFLINLFSDFRFNFTNITGKKGHETLCAGVNNINFMKGHRVNNFFSFLKFSFRTLYKSGLWTNVIIITAASKGSSKLRDFAACFVNGNNITSLDLLLRDCFNHFRA